MLGNGLCTRPVELECRMESACETCAYFKTGPSSCPSCCANATTLENKVRPSGSSSSKNSSSEPAERRLDTDYTYNTGHGRISPGRVRTEPLKSGIQYLRCAPTKRADSGPLHEVLDSVSNPGLVSQPRPCRCSNDRADRTAEEGSEAASHCGSSHRSSGSLVACVSRHNHQRRVMSHSADVVGARNPRDSPACPCLRTGLFTLVQAQECPV